MFTVMYATSYAIDAVATGRNIRNCRLRRGLSVSDISESFGGMSRNSIYKWERGQTLPSLDNLYSLSRLLGVTMDELIVGKDWSQDQSGDDQPSPVFKIFYRNVPAGAFLFFIF